MAKQKKQTIKLVTETVEVWENRLLPTAGSFDEKPKEQLVLRGKTVTTTEYDYADEEEADAE